MHRTYRIVIEGIAPLIQDNPAESDQQQLTGNKKKTTSKQQKSEEWRKKMEIIHLTQISLVSQNGRAVTGQPTVEDGGGI